MSNKFTILVFFALVLFWSFMSTTTEPGIFKNICFIFIGAYSTLFIYELFKKEKE